MILRVGILVLSLAAASVAQDARSLTEVHEQDEAKWAQQTGLTPFAVHQLWRFASHFADTADDDSRIQFLDVDGLGRNHVLLVTYAGSDYCLTLTVLAYAKGYQELWTEDTTPEGMGFCGAEARVWISDHKIIVSVLSSPSRVEGGQVEISNYAYGWDGKTYRFTGKWKMWRRNNK